MLPVYEAVSLARKKRLAGGSTFPWLVEVKTEKGIVLYVVKIFKRPDENESIIHQPIAKEILVSILAEEFELPVPKPALIRFTDNFLQIVEVEAPDLYADWKKKDQNRIKFGSLYIEGANPYSVHADIKLIGKYDIETIFAFDALILNVDRRESKPNLLIKDKEFYVIDHELSLSINELIIFNLQKGQLSYRYNNHLFYSHLKVLPADKKAFIFDTFSDYLQRMKVLKLDKYVEQLEGLGYPLANYDDIKFYLKLAQQKLTDFINNLKGAIQ